jgi:uncharacterized protein YciI
MKHILCKLIPPRPTFDRDMNEAEAKVMQEHIAYWASLADKGTAVVFGPVSDPNGAWGVAIVEIEDEVDAPAITNNDPVINSGLGFRYEFYAMPRIISRK